MNREIEVLLISQYLREGGAGRAAWRIFKALELVEEETGVRPRFHVVRGAEELPRVTSEISKLRPVMRLLFLLRLLLGRIAPRLLLRPAWPSLHSAASVRTGLLDSPVAASADVINLHWLGDATLSIEEIGNAHRPVVWTLHDMWPYCGAEHLTPSQRFKEGYLNSNRPRGEYGPDINRQVWERKVLSWRGQQAVIAPSRWAAENAQNSVVFKNRQIREIPHPIDLDFWRPQESGFSTSQNEPNGKIRLGLVASADYESWAKGFDLVEGILCHLSRLIEIRAHKFELIVLGPNRGVFRQSVIEVNQSAPLSNDVDMRQFYHKVDVLLLPSLVDTFGLVAAEAHACGTPVVCFGGTGVASVVAHLETGYVARKGEVEDFANGIAWIVESSERRFQLSTQSRQRAESMWDERRVGRLYADFFRELVEDS